MSDLDPRRVLDAATGETPSPEFLARLRAELDDELAGQSDGSRTVASDVPVIDAVLDEREQDMDSRRKTAAWIAAAAAVILVIVGIMVVTNDDDDDEAETDTVDQPETGDGAEAGEGDGDGDTPEETAPPATDPEPPPPTDLPDPWAFEITYLDVPAGIGVAATENFAWVPSGDGTLSTIDLATNTVLSTAQIPPDAGVTNYGFGSVWSTHNEGDGPLPDSTLTRFDPETATVTATIDLGGFAWWVEPGDDALWAGVRTPTGGQAVRIDPATDSIVARIDVGPGSGSVVTNSDGVWMRDFVTGDVVRIDPATNAVVATITVDDQGLSFVATTGAAWAPGTNSGVLHRIDTATDTVAAQIDVSDAVGTPVALHWVHSSGDTVWLHYSEVCDGPDCPHGIARVDPETNEIVATEMLRDGSDWIGLSAGPTTVWTVSDDAVVRFDFTN